jgi:hypothetical protein
MRIIFFALFSLAIASFLSAQNVDPRQVNESKIKLNNPNISRATKQTENNQPVSTLTPEQRQTIANRAATKEALLAPNEILMKYLGVASYDDPSYKQKKEKLFYENPDAYKEMSDKLNASNKVSKTKISRTEYNSYPAEKKSVIDLNKDKYEIVE